MNATPAPRSGRRTQNRVTALFTAPPQAGGLGYNDLGASTGNRPAISKCAASAPLPSL